MTLTQLRIFAAIAEIGNVTRAAQELGITQSAASAAIANLESMYQVRLFERVGRSIVLSEVGKRFLPEAREALAGSANAIRALHILSEKTIGTLQIAASQTIANYWLPRKLASFHTSNPGVSVNVKMSNTKSVETAVLLGQVNIGLVEGKVNLHDLDLIEVDQDQPVLVVSPKKWSELGITSNKNDIKNLPWIVREQGSGTRRILEELIQSLGLEWSELDVILELPSNEAVREAVIAGAGVTLISETVVNLSIENQTLRSVNLDIPTRSFSMVTRKQRVLSHLEEGLKNVILGKAHDPQILEL